MAAWDRATGLACISRRPGASSPRASGWGTARARRRRSAGGWLRHRAAGGTTFDGGLAAELEACARGEGERGRWAAARALFLQASRLSPRAADRDRRFLAAADALLSAGDVTAFDALSDRI